MDVLVYVVPSNYALHYFTEAAAKQGLAKPSLQFDNHMAIDHMGSTCCSSLVMPG